MILCFDNGIINNSLGYIIGPWALYNINTIFPDIGIPIINIILSWDDFISGKFLNR